MRCMVILFREKAGAIMLRGFIILLGALCAAVTSAAAETPIERGSYLVNAVMVCDGCHTPRGPGGLNMERRFSGGPQVWDEARPTPCAAPISRPTATLALALGARMTSNGY
jgi:hypothetical protein